MICARHWWNTTLYTRSMIAFACGWFVVPSILFGLNAMIVLHTHLFELTFGLAHTPIVKDNKLRSRLTCQPRIMKQILDGCCWLICGFDIFKPTSGWIYHCECMQRVRVLAGVLNVNGWDPPVPHIPWPRDTVSDSAILGGSSPYFLRSFFIIWHTWQVEHKQSMFNILCKTRPCHGIPEKSFLFFSVPDEVNIHGTRKVLSFVCLNDWGMQIFSL
jgi:hypothetical protein